MGTFTIALKKVVTATGGTVEIIDGLRVMTGGDIGLNHYPLFDEEYRPHLNGRIIDRYWNREIGLETIEMFQLAVRRKMNEIMPYYNGLYKSEKIAYDPLSTVDIKTVSIGNARQVGESEGVSDAIAVSTGTARTVVSETPQTMLSGNGDYASGATDTTSSSSNDSNGTQTSSETQETDSTNDSHTTGYQGVSSELIMRYRESLLNIDLMILAELEDCFMGIWDNGDTYTNNRTGYLL